MRARGWGEVCPVKSGCHQDRTGDDDGHLDASALTDRDPTTTTPNPLLIVFCFGYLCYVFVTCLMYWGLVLTIRLKI